MRVECVCVICMFTRMHECAHLHVYMWRPEVHASVFPLLLATSLFYFMTSPTHNATYQQPHLQTPSSTTPFPFIRSRSQTVNYQYQHATVYDRTDECEREARAEADKVRAERRFQSLDNVEDRLT